MRNGLLALSFKEMSSLAPQPRTRRNSISYGDLWLRAILCKRHHIFWKKQHPDVFMLLGEGAHRWTFSLGSWHVARLVSADVPNVSDKEDSRLAGPEKRGKANA
jgi:hypothetical protein